MTAIIAITRFILPLTCALFLPMAAAAQTIPPGAPAEGCCGAMHQMPATAGTAVNRSAHQDPGGAKPATPAVPGMKADTVCCCCGGAERADTPMATMDCCAGMDG